MEKECIITDVGMIFAVGIPSAEVGLSLAEVSASGQRWGLVC